MVRPRSARAHREVLEAAATLFAERGIDATSMDSIAASSGVSKATIYKHWPDKDKLALEVLSHIHGLNEEQPVFDSGSVRADLISQLTYQPAEDRTEMKERIMPHLMAYSVRNHEFGRAWRALVIDRQRSAIRAILERGVKQRQLDCQLNVDLGIALLFGPILYQHIFLSPTKVSKPPLEFVAQIVDAFLRAFAIKGEPMRQAERPQVQKRNR
jgi:AcrR family transcriptional regulator